MHGLSRPRAQGDESDGTLHQRLAADSPKSEVVHGAHDHGVNFRECGYSQPMNDGTVTEPTLGIQDLFFCPRTSSSFLFFSSSSSTFFLSLPPYLPLITAATSANHRPAHGFTV